VITDPGAGSRQGSPGRAWAQAQARLPALPALIRARRVITECMISEQAQRKIARRIKIESRIES